jgi:2-oxo-4-hydroxy-4-carboxy-5-ureidoimidazoline decarboxylase
MAAWQRLDAADDAMARQLLSTCCGSGAWVERMLARRPFGSDARLLAVARDEWFALAPEEWREAFRHHPRIGERQALAARFPRTAHLSAEEQRGVAGANDGTLDALAQANDRYERRFGYIFIVCATGKTADEMLALLGDRLHNEPQTELIIAAREQSKITELRLIKLDAGVTG